MNGLVDFSDDSSNVEQPSPIRSAPLESKGVAVDTRYEPKSHLITHIQGAGWTVNYYSQVLNTDNAVLGQQLDRNAVYQQYMYVERLELRVTAPLTTTQDPTSKEMIITGTANVYPSLIPNKGDMFIADVGDGRTAIFQVTSTDRRSIFKDTSYVIDYTLINYTTKELRNDLDTKVVKRFAFRRDFLQYGQSPLIIMEEADQINKLELYFKEIIQIYFKTFVSNEYKTLIVPGQVAPIYDHFLVKAMKSFFNTWDCPDIQYVRLLNLDDDNNMKTPTIWDMLYNMNLGLLNYIAPTAGLVGAKTFTRDPMMEGVYHSGISYVVYPDVSWKEVDYELNDRSKPFDIVTLRNVPPRTNLAMFSPNYKKECSYCDGDVGATELVIPYNQAKTGTDVVDPTNDGYTVGSGNHNDHVWDFSDILGDIDATVTIPDIHLVTVDNFYVFARAFYLQETDTQNPGMSKLECAVCQMLLNKKIDNTLLIYFCETYHSWGALERFYYMPILLILIRYSLRGHQ